MLKKTAWIWIAALALTLTLPALAGGHTTHKECPEGTENCLTAMVAKLQTRGWLGIETEKTESGRYRITRVVEGSPAATYGLQEGDILIALNGIELSEANHEQIARAKESLTPGARATYTVKRSSGKAEVAVTLGTVPAEVMAEWVGRHMIDYHAQTQVATK